MISARAQGRSVQEKIRPNRGRAPDREVIFADINKAPARRRKSGHPYISSSARTQEKKNGDSEKRQQRSLKVPRHKSGYTLTPTIKNQKSEKSYSQKKRKERGVIQTRE